jgi:hypothetical protein
MSYTRVFNDFKRRLLNGEVEPSFNCSAYLMNSGYAQIYDNLQYMRSISDFENINYDALHTSPIYGITGSALATGQIIQNDYYREKTYDEESDFTSDPIFVTSANSASYMSYAAGTDLHRKAIMQDYINTFGGFFLVGKIDEFNKMCSMIEENDCERYAVVLADDIENIIVNNALFNKTRQHPFRGVFDGNGYALQIQKMFVNDRTCGVFGYIADEGVVRNLVIQPVKAEGVSAIDVFSTSQISLDTIKLGQGDVRFGVLAGVNEGMCEKVVVSANLSFNGKWRPNIYFTHNKYVDDSVSEVSLYSPEWQSAPSYNVADVTAISSYTNLCFPTQLCINSEANLIPYVGYFGEAAFAHAVEQAAYLEKPLYEYPMSGTLGCDGFSRSDGTTTFCRDIELLYSQHCKAFDDAKGHNEDTYSPLHTQGHVMQRGTFRLGPNHRAAYLIGGVFGLNNGTLNTVGYDGTMQFNNCTVALIGGIAGRQARGTSYDSIGRVNISTTSGAFADKVKIKLPEKTYKSQYLGYTLLSAVVPVSTTVPGSVTIYETNGSNTQTYACSINSTNQAGKKFLPMFQYESSYVGELSASASDNGQSDYSFHACKILSVSSIILNQLQLPDDISVNCAAFPGGAAALKPYGFSIANGYLRIDDIDGSPQTGYVVTQDTNTYQQIPGKTEEDVTLVKNTSRVFVNLSGSIGNPASSVFCTVTATLSSTSLDTYKVTAVSTDDRVPKTGEFSAINIILPPLFHVGGYCGEYVITDRYLRADKRENTNNTINPYDYYKTQLLYDMIDVGGFAYLDENAVVGDAETLARQYGTYNSIAGFAANISIDTMNKSDCDTISAYPYTSATSLHYKYFYDVNFTAQANGDSDLISVFSSPSIFAKYINYVPDMMPAVVMAASHGHSHSRGDTYEPNFGITWLDQLFYGTGPTAPGYEGEDDQSNVAYWMKNGEWADRYINTISQAGYSEVADRASEQNAVYYDRESLLNTFIKFNNAYQSVTLTAYETKQHVPNTINAPYQYPNGRAGYNSSKYSDASTRVSSYSFDYKAESNYYNTVIGNAHFLPGIEPTDVKSDLLPSVTGMQPTTHLQSYIFSYSSTPVLNGTLPPVKLNLTYTTAYSLTDMSRSTAPSEVTARLAEEQTRKCYMLTSDSFSTIYESNTTPPGFTFKADDNMPITSNRLVYGFIPSTADIVKCLDADPLAHVYCSGVSANDLQYVLVVDEENRPIFDIKLDVESVENQGYSVAFDRAGHHYSNGVGLSYVYDGGMGINIKTGN